MPADEASVEGESFFGGFALGSALLDFETAEDDVVEITHVVKGSDSDLAPGEGLVDGGLDGLRHVVEVDLDLTALHVAHDLEVVELAVLPGDAFLDHGEIGARGLVDDEDLTRILIGDFAEVEVVIVGGVLVVEEESEVAVAAGGLRGLNARGEH